MWAVTGWALATWVKVTLFLAAAVVLAWLLLPPGWFALVLVLAGIADLYAARQLAREWADEARFTCWWWNR